LKTLHLTNAWHANSGGIRTFYRALLEAANGSGHQMRLIVPGEANRVEAVGRYGRIYHLRAPRAPVCPSYRILYPQRALLPGGDVHRILREERPDLVEFCDKYTMNYVGGLLRVGRLPGIGFRPTVVGLSCERMAESFRNYAGAPGAAERLARWYLRWLYFPMADHHIAVSGYVAEELRSVSGGHKVNRGVWVGEMGVNAKVFASGRRDEGVRRRLLGDGRRLLVYAGRLAREKNIGLLFGMMRELSAEGYRLALVGSGDERAELEREAERVAPGRVCFAGHCGDAEQLAGILASCDAFVHPNAAEPFGIAPLEAMAAGLPLIAPHRGGVTTYAHDGNAWLSEPTAEGFAAAARAVFADCGERERRTAAARETAFSRDWPVAAARYLALYRELHARMTGAGEAALDPAFFSTRSYTE
jgi:glycosyltransferase involved in cell wall biosynthesis